MKISEKTAGRLSAQFSGSTVPVPDGSGWQQFTGNRVAHYWEHLERGTPRGRLMPLCERPMGGSCGRMDVSKTHWAPVKRAARNGDCVLCAKRWAKRRGEIDEVKRERDALQAEVRRLTTERRLGEESAYALSRESNDEARREAERADALQEQLDATERRRRIVAEAAGMLQIETSMLRVQLAAKPPRFCGQCGGATDAGRIVLKLHERLQEARIEPERLANTFAHLFAWQQARHVEWLAQWRCQMGEHAGAMLERDALRTENERLKVARDSARAQVERLREALDALLSDLPLPERETIEAADAALSETEVRDA